MLKRKADVFDIFKQFRDLVEKSTGRFIKFLRIGNGIEFTSKEFDNVYTPQQNGVVERMNMTLLERERSMLSNEKFQQELWGEEFLTACYLVNRS